MVWTYKWIDCDNKQVGDNVFSEEGFAEGESAKDVAEKVIKNHNGIGRAYAAPVENFYLPHKFSAYGKEFFLAAE